MILIALSPLLLILLFAFYSNWGNARRFNSTNKYPCVPFGYRGLPGIGFLPHFHRSNCQKILINMKKQYGKICKVKMGSIDCIVLNDYELIKCAWNQDVFCNRPKLPGVLERTYGFKGGIIFNDGKDFVDQRKFVLQLLKSNGLGKASTEVIVINEIKNVMNTINKKNGEQISTRHLFNLASFNILWHIITGGSSGFPSDNQEIQNLATVLNRHMELNDGARAAVFMPWLPKYFPWFIGWKEYIREANEIFDFWLKFAKGTYRNSDGRGEPDSLLNSYCEKISTTENSGSSFYQENGIRSFATVLQDLFIAGSETTASTIQWALLYLAAFPKCQDKINKEVLDIIGQNEIPNMHHIEKLPYTEAFIYETLRYSTLAPLGMFHCTSDDVLFHGYFIPKDSIVLSNICAVHYDPDYWTQPEIFMPERFLESNDEGGKIKNDRIPSFIPFSTGKRYCPGSILAKQTLFLTITLIVQKYRITLCNESKVSLCPHIGISAIPQPHELCFIDRVQ